MVWREVGSSLVGKSWRFKLLKTAFSSFENRALRSEDVKICSDHQNSECTTDPHVQHEAVCDKFCSSLQNLSPLYLTASVSGT